MSEGGEFMNAEEFQSMLRVWCLGIGINKPPEELLHRIKELVDKEGENRITQDEANRTLERVLSFMYKNKR